MKRERHGLHGTQLYEVWKAMKQRCYNCRHKDYVDYGGRGITVCERWRNSFLAFRDDVGERPSEDYTLDRKENDNGYEPGNVHWATWDQQRANSRYRPMPSTTKATPEIVERIMALRETGLTYKQIAATVGTVKRSQVSNICLGRRKTA